MRNLEIVRRHLIQDKQEFFQSNDSCCYCIGESGQLNVVDAQEETVLKFSTGFLPETRKRPDEGLDDVFQMQYVSTTGYLFLAKRNGELLLTKDGIFGYYEEFLKSEQGIKTFAVSSDCRRIAILTSQKTLVLLSMPDLETLFVNQLSSKEESRTNTGDYNGSIVWRNDCSYFAVNIPNFNGDDSLQREIRVYNEEGLLYSTSQLDEFQILNHLLLWQPSGGLIASYGKSPHGHCIIFSELNGLKRSNLQLKSTENVIDMSWNFSSDILSVIFKNYVQLWIRSNYVWMLKKTLCFGLDDTNKKDVKYCNWDNELPYRIHIMYDDQYVAYDLTYKFTSGFSDSSSIVASWNANNIYCTPLRENSAPPPYGFYQVKVNSHIDEVLISSFWDGFICITTSKELILFRRTENSINAIDKCLLPKGLPISETSGWTWLNLQTLCCICNGSLILINLEIISYSGDKLDENQPDKELSFESISMPGIRRDGWFRLYPLKGNNNESDDILLETEDQLIKMNIKTKETSTILRLPQVFSSLSFILDQSNNVIVFLYNSLSHKLFMGSSEYQENELVKLSLDCTSITTFCDNLLLTTSTGNLEIYNKNLLLELLQQEPSGEENQLTEKKFSRKIEKGSVIVNCSVNKMLEPSLTLQIIPRGNFETICPRPLLVTTIRQTLRDESNNLRFAKIMTALRRHRLDYKVLIDEMREMEKDNSSVSVRNLLSTMVEQVQDSHSLVLLVTDLDNEYVDCIEMIKEILENRLSHETERKPNIEEAYLAAMAKLGFLEAALLSHLIQGESKEQRNLVTHRVKFLSYYCENPDILFDTSLGTYDLTLASLVADCLGKDPKEYVPILDDLQALSELKRKFKIDDKLRRYSKAIEHLLNDPLTQCPEFLKYMERHRLFTDVIWYIEDMQIHESSGRTPEELTVLLQESKVSYGRYLEEHTKFREAVILYRGGMEFQKAIECAIKSGEWEIALDIFYSHLFTEANFKLLCENILEDLDGRKNYSGAARLCEVYLRDYSRAVGYWTRDRKWLKAKSLAQIVPELRTPCLEETIKPNLLEAARERKEYLTTLTKEVCQRFDRWCTVKSEKSRKALEGGGDDCDFSDIDSVSSYSSKSGSSGTGKTCRSGKNKRKLERKLYSMKEGSRHEDLAISAHLWNICDKIQQELKPDTTNLICTLWDFNENLSAKDLGILFDELLYEAGKAIQEIWPAVLPDELLEMKYRIPPPDWSTSWNKLCLHDPSSKAVKQ